VSLIFNDRPGARQKSDYVRGLRCRLGGDIAVSAGEMRIFLYAGTAEAAGQAEHVAREVLAAQHLSADFRLERWDPSGQAWRDARAEATGLPAAHDDNRGRRRLRSAGALIGSVVQAVIDGILP